MIRRSVLAVTAVAALLASPMAAPEDAPQMAVRRAAGPPTIPVDRTKEEGVLSGSASDSIEARVSSVDLARRLVKLHESDGGMETVVAGPEVKNLEKLERGDRVKIRYRVGLVLRRLAPGDAPVAPQAEKQMQNTGEGDILSGGEVVRGRMTMTVTAVDAASRIVTLKGGDDRVFTVKAGPGVALDAVRTGDRFAATYSVGMAVSVDPIYRQ